MNFEFHIMAHGFEKAAKLEAALKSLNIPYETKVAKGVANTTGKKRKRLDKAEVAAVLVTIDSHPSWDDITVAKQSGIGRNTVNRIRRGIHPLSPKKTPQIVKQGVSK